MNPCKITGKKSFYLASMLFLVLISFSTVLNAQSSPSMYITINKEKFYPGDTLLAIVHYTEIPAYENAELIIKNSNGDEVFREYVSAENMTEYNFDDNALAGEWLITASYGNISAERLIAIEKKEAIDSVVIGDTLLIKNIGNTRYTKAIEISFVDSRGETQTEMIKLDLAINQEADFKLEAKKGFYNVIVGGKKFNTVPLTGKIASVIKVENKKGFLSQSVAATFLIFVVLLVFIVMLAYNLKEKPFRARSRSNEYITIERKESLKGYPAEKTQTGTSVISFYPSRKAEHSLVLQGEKQGTTIVVINAKNLSELKSKLEGVAFNALTEFIDNQATREIEQNRGFAKKITDHSIMGIFSPATKQFRHESIGVKTALNIRNELDNYNRKLKDKLEYGIGVNTGELVVSLSRDMKYTSMGNTISLAKKISEMAKNEVYAAKSTYSRVSSEVQGSNAGKINTINGDTEIYSIKAITSREANKSYLNDILKRIK